MSSLRALHFCRHSAILFSILINVGCGSYSNLSASLIFVASQTGPGRICIKGTSQTDGPGHHHELDKGRARVKAAAASPGRPLHTLRVGAASARRRRTMGGGGGVFWAALLSAAIGAIIAMPWEVPVGLEGGPLGLRSVALGWLCGSRVAHLPLAAIEES